MVCLPSTGKREKDFKTIGEEILSLQFNCILKSSFTLFRDIKAKVLHTRSKLLQQMDGFVSCDLTIVSYVLRSA